MNRRKYTREFKVEACKLVVDQEQKISVTSRDLGVGEPMLGRWVRSYRADPLGAFPGEGTKQVPGGDPKIRELEAEVRKLRLEREILKKAMAYFVKNPG